MEQRIGFIGAGNMAEAIIGATIRAELAQPGALFASDIRMERLDYLKETYGITPARDSESIISACDILFLAVKPQQMNDVLQGISAALTNETKRRKLIISIAAGVRIEKIEAALYASLSETARSKRPIIRVMPNTPALVLKGMSGMSANAYASAEDIENARTLLGAMGRVIQFPEKDLDAVTALSGSGPAYVFYLAEQMIAAGVELGLCAQDAETLTLATMEGAVALLKQGTDSPEALRAKVTSPGGTTAAAIGYMESNQVPIHIVRAIIAAAERSRDLSR